MSNNVPAPKFNIGDKVWHAHVGRSQVKEKCPDCIGEGVWHCRLPNGEDLDITCPTCAGAWGELRGYVHRQEITGSVRQMTIGSVRLDTSSENPISYMCVETGVGNGNVWYEPDLFADKAEAEAAIGPMVEAARVAAEESFARHVGHKRGDRPGSMTSYYRKMIRDAKKQIKQAESGLERESRKAVQS